MTDQVAGAIGAETNAGNDLATGDAKFTAAVKSQNNNQSGGTHIVEKGDTLWGISKEYYGKGSEFTKIQSANNLEPGAVLHPGTPLIIPVPDNVAEQKSVPPKMAQEEKPAVEPKPDEATLKQDTSVQIPPAGTPLMAGPDTVIAPDNSATIEPEPFEVKKGITVPSQEQQKSMVDGLKDKLLDGVDDVEGMLVGAANSQAAELMGKVAVGALPDAVLGAVKFEFGGEVVLVAELVPTPKKGLENWDAKNSTTFISYKGRVYTLTPNGAVETGKPIFPMKSASDMFPALANNKIAQKTLLFGNDRSGVDLDGAVSPKFNLRSRNLGAIWALNDPAAKADAKRQSLAEKAVDVLVADKMEPLEKAEMASDAVTAGIVLGTGGAATPGAIVKKVITKTGLHFAKKEIIKEVKEAIKDEIKEGATFFAGVAYRANVQVDPKSDTPLKIQTPLFTIEPDPYATQGAQDYNELVDDYFMQRSGGIINNF